MSFEKNENNILIEESRWPAIEESHQGSGIVSVFTGCALPNGMRSKPSSYGANYEIHFENLLFIPGGSLNPVERMHIWR